MGIQELRFNDVSIKEYNEYAIPLENSKNIEDEIVTLIYQDITMKKLRLFYQRVCPEDIETFHLPSIDKANLLFRNRDKKRQRVPKVTNFDKIITNLFHEFYSANQKIETLSDECRKCGFQVKTLEEQVKTLEEQIEQIRNSRGY